MTDPGRSPSARIAFVIAHFGPGGAQRVLSEVANALAADDYDVHVVTILEEPVDIYPLHPSITRHRLARRLVRERDGGDGREPMPTPIRLAREVRRATRNVAFFSGTVVTLRATLRTIAPDTVLSLITVTNVMTILATRGLSVRTLVSERNDLQLDRHHRGLEALRRWVYPWADVVTANTHGALSDLERFVPKPKLAYLPNPVRVPVSHEKVAYTAPTFVCAARLAHQKGIDTLLKASARAFDVLFGLRVGAVAARLVADRRVDLVHGLGASALGYARRHRADGPATAPLVFNPQGLEEFGATDPGRARLKRLGYVPLQAAVRACARAADRIIATDRALMPSLLRHLRASEDRVRLIPNAIDVEECDEAARESDRVACRRRVALAADDLVMLSVGRLEVNKGFETLVEALSRLAGDDETARFLGPRWRWVLVGDGPRRGAIERAIYARGLRDHVWLTGRVDETELHAWFGTATLFVHPTLYEGSSLVTLEAMTHGRAVVSTDAGGLPDKVRPGVNGWRVPPGDVRALATAIADALSDRQRLEAYGIAGRGIVEREFAWPAVAGQLLAVYQELLIA